MGGTAEWTHRLIEGLPDVEFQVVAVSASGREPAELRYELPSNVTRLVDLALDDAALIKPHARRRLRRHEATKPSWELVSGAYAGMIRNHYEGFGDLYRVIRRQLGGWDLFRSREHWQLVETYYRYLAPDERFSDFYWTFRSSHLLLYRVLMAELPPADVYHAIAAGYAGLTGVCAKTAHGGKLLLTEHGLYQRERELEIVASRWLRGCQKDLMARLFDKLNRLIYAHSDCIVSLFEDARQAQIGMGADAQRTCVIPNGVDMTRFGRLPAHVRQESSPSRGHDRSATRVGLVARVVAIKDIKAFIRIAKIVGDALPNVDFRVIGPTDEEPAYFESCLELVRELGLEDRLTFTGYRAPEDYLPTLDIVVLTSLQEAQPLAVLEAMACGIPVVATRTGSLPEMLDGVGIIVSQGDLEGFANAVIALAREPRARERLGVAARERITSSYDQRPKLERYRELYGSLVHESSPPRAGRRRVTTRGAA